MFDASRASADVIRLKNGTVLEGDIRRQDEGWVVIDATGKSTRVAAESVASIEARPKGGASAPEAGLASLRRVSDNAADARDVVKRYKSFIDQYAGTPIVEKAKADLAIWQDRVDKGLIKVGDRWVTPDEKKALLEQSFHVASEAMQLIKQARLREAAPVVDSALAENPQNGAAWYLKGLLLYRQDQLVPARKAFESAAALMPDHAPTFNNLGVIQWRQNQFVAALNQYDRALLAAPLGREILDNMAEALHALPPESRNGIAARKVARHFAEQDLLLQAKMKQSGLYRWGATWVRADELASLQAAEKDINDELARMSADYDVATLRIQQIEQDIDRNERLARRMELDTYGVDSTGRQFRYPLPGSYYDVVRDIAVLKNERAQRLADQERMRRAVRTVQQRLSTPKYTGVQRLIDTEGTPLPGAAAPAAREDPAANRDGGGGAPTTSPAPAAAPPASRAGVARPPAAMPPEKPSILDRRLSDPSDGALPPKLLDDPPAR